MAVKIQKWGNSQGLRLTRQLLDSANIAVGDEVEVSTRDGLIMITPVRRVRGRRNLQELVARIPSDYHVEETEWGGPVGKEAW